MALPGSTTVYASSPRAPMPWPTRHRPRITRATRPPPPTTPGGCGTLGGPGPSLPDAVADLSDRPADRIEQLAWRAGGVPEPSSRPGGERDRIGRPALDQGAQPGRVSPPCLGGGERPPGGPVGGAPRNPPSRASAGPRPASRRRASRPDDEPKPG